MTNNKVFHDLEASLAVIETNMKAYHSGDKLAYIPVAVELRKLLCDSQRGEDISVLKRLFPDLDLHPLLEKQEKIGKYTALYIPGQVQYDGLVGSDMNEPFNEAAPALSLDEWLEQKLFDAITISEFIRAVADKHAAHSDEDYNSTLDKTKSASLSDETLSATTILTISRYLVKVLALRWIDKNITEIGAYVASEFSQKGRGFAVLHLAELATDFSNGVPITYEPSSAIHTYLRDSAIHRAAVMQTLQDYQPSKEFILFIVDFNGWISFYSQALSL